MTDSVGPSLLVPTAQSGGGGDVLSSQAATGAWTYINSARNDTPSASTTFTIPATSLTTGNHIFVFVSYPISYTCTIADTAGNTYTPLEVGSGAAMSPYGRWYYCLNAIGNASNVITLTQTSSGIAVNGALSMQFNKTGNAAALDNSSSWFLTSTSTSITGIPVNTNMSGLLVTCAAAPNPDTSVAFSGVTGLVNPFSNDSLNRVVGAYLINTAGALTGATPAMTGTYTGSQARTLCTLSITEAVTTSYDPYFSNVVLLLNGDGSNGGTTFTDSSAYNRTMTLIAGPVTSTTQKKFGSAAIYVASSGSLVTPLSADMVFTGDFTIEMWVYFTNTASSQYFFSNFQGPSVYINVWTGQFYSTIIFGAGVTVSNVSANTWHHITISRASGHIVWAVDGRVVFKNNDSTVNGTGGVDKWYFGTIPVSGFAAVSGIYIDAVRFTKGTGRYSGDFALPTMPWAGISSSSISPGVGVVLLTHFDGTNGQTTTTDSSVSAHVMTMTGCTLSTTQKAFGTAAVQLPYNGYVTTPYTSDFALMGAALSCTIEFWLYIPSAPSSAATILSCGNTSYSSWYMNISSLRVPTFYAGTGGTAVAVTSGAIPTATWTHIAFVLNAGACTLYVAGTGGTPVTMSGYTGYTDTRLMLGTPYSAQMPTYYMDEVRITKGTAVYTSNFSPPVYPYSNPSAGNPTGTTLLIHMDGVAGSTTFTDSSTYAQGITNSTTYPVQIADAPVKIGTGSAYFLGISATPSYLTLANSSGGYNTAWNTLTTSVSGTIEFWMYSNSVHDQGIMEWMSTLIPNWYISYHYPGIIILSIHSPAGFITMSSSSAIPAFTWGHVAIVNNAGTITIYINGIGGTPLTPTNIGSLGGITLTGPGPLHIGAHWGGSYSGYLDELRISSTAVYTTNFTPPTSPLS